MPCAEARARRGEREVDGEVESSKEIGLPTGSPKGLTTTPTAPTTIRAHACWGRLNAASTGSVVLLRLLLPLVIGCVGALPSATTFMSLSSTERSSLPAPLVPPPPPPPFREACELLVFHANKYLFPMPTTRLGPAHVKHTAVGDDEDEEEAVEVVKGRSTSQRARGEGTLPPAGTISCTVILRRALPMPVRVATARRGREGVVWEGRVTAAARTGP